MPKSKHVLANRAARALPLVIWTPRAIKSQILQMADQSLCHIRGGPERSRRTEKVLKVFIRRIEHHPDEGDRRQRRPQSLQLVAEAASVEGRCRHGPTY